MATRDVTGQLLRRLATGPVNETYRQLAEEFGASQRMVKWAVAKLRRDGLVRVEYTTHDGMSHDRSSRVITLLGGAR